MKKTLSLLALATVITSFSSMAHADMLSVRNNSYNMIVVTTLDNGTVKDKICLQDSMVASFNNYLPNHDYSIEVKFYRNGCSGEVLDEVKQDFQALSGMTKLSVDQDGRIINN